ncbi:uncharacterized protein LOC141699836 [Apium graveolens]|uniref:uncharacterized protein LOC141699836 n=1 Tax=Apium graveolens TaxID=4045 RepID=UPI003D7AF34E
MDSESNVWIGLPRYSTKYGQGVTNILDNAFPVCARGKEMKCPCKNCIDRKWHTREVINDHLIYSGPSLAHVKWIYETSQMKPKVSTNFMDYETGMEFGNNLEEMFKCMGKNESAFGELLKLMKEVFPEAHLPLSFNAAKNVIKDLGLHYEKIHACPNSCMLYWAENKDKDECHTCGVSRWVVKEKKGSGVNNEPEKLIHKVPTNVMRYFPLKPRLQRMLLCKEFSKIMTWHAVGRKNDGKLRHPTDGEAWKMMDAQYPDFSSEHRNVNLGVASDGFFLRKMCYMNHMKFLEPTHKWRLDKNNFNGDIKMGLIPPVVSGTDIEELLQGGKSKDHLEARFDLQEQNIRKPLHPVLSADGKSYEIRPAIFDMNKKEKEIFCSVLKNAKLPYDCASNISQYVSIIEKKVVGYKSHDAHFMLHYLLQFALRRILKPEVALPLIKLGTFLRGLWSKVIDLNDFKKLQKDIFDILCRFEIIFIQSLFEIMVHLLVHLCREVEYGGPVQLRSMFPIERFLGNLKSYVRNRRKPEGSIAEGYLAEECVTFCSRFLTGEGEIEDTMSHSARNTSLEEHRVSLDGEATSKRLKRERTHTSDFWIWLKEQVLSKDSISRDLEVLALGPTRAARQFTGYVVNGYRFHTKSRDSRCITQNSGVFVTAETTSFASSKDKNPVIGNVNYYGSVEEIFELDYWGVFNVVLFKCCWYQEEKDEYGLTKKLPRDVCDAENENATEEEIRTTTLDDIDIDPETEFEVSDESCFRDDVPQIQIPFMSP